MARPPLAIELMTLLVITAGLAEANGPAQRDALAEVLLTDLVVGETTTGRPDARLTTSTITQRK